MGPRIWKSSSSSLLTQGVLNRSVWWVSSSCTRFQANSWSKAARLSDMAVKRQGPTSRSALRRFFSMSFSTPTPADLRSAA